MISAIKEGKTEPKPDSDEDEAPRSKMARIRRAQQRAGIVREAPPPPEAPAPPPPPSAFHRVESTLETQRYAMALHPFRRFAATGGTSASIRIWTAATRPAGADEDESGALGEWCEVADLSRERDAHSDMVLALEFLDAARAPPELPREGGDPAAWGNGRVWLASAGADRSIRVWSGPLDMSKSVVHPGNVGGAGGAGAVAEEERLPEDEQKVFEIIEPLEGGAGRVVEHRSQKAFEAVDAVRP